MRGFLGSLAQPVEQRTFNPLVERSNRSRPTKHKNLLHKSRFFLIPNTWSTKPHPNAIISTLSISTIPVKNKQIARPAIGQPPFRQPEIGYNRAFAEHNTRHRHAGLFQPTIQIKNRNQTRSCTARNPAAGNTCRRYSPTARKPDSANRRRIRPHTRYTFRNRQPENRNRHRKRTTA